MAFVVVCEHLMPMLIVRRDPEQVLDVLLPVFHAVAQAAHAADGDDRAGDRRRGASAMRETAPADDDDAGRRRPRASRTKGRISEEEGRELLQSIVDFTETVVREVMTPRPDIVAIRPTRRCRTCGRCSARSSTRACRSIATISTTSSASSS